MAGNAETGADVLGLPASLQRKAKVPSKIVQFNIPLSWWEELSGLAREFDQDVSTFLREATDDWLQRARRARESPPPPANPIA